MVPDECGKAVVAKTGLGSSAALTTSLVGALLQWFGVVRLGYRWSEEDRRIVHNLSQLVHANAQGKIGSGFDVASAVYGTQVYQRFSQEPFTTCLEERVSGKQIYDTVTNTSLWNQEVIPFNFPPGIDIILCDVCGGSSSTSMVGNLFMY
jgi:phosphomevalonate kinase